MINIDQYHTETIEDSTKVGVYMIYHLVYPTRVYIGSTASIKGKGNWKGFRSRWLSHIGPLINNKHGNVKLQRLINKYGLDGIRIKIVEICVIKNIINREQYWIDWYKSVDNGYNIARSAKSPALGTKQSPETIRKRVEKATITKKEKYKNNIWPIASIQGTKEGWDRAGKACRSISLEGAKIIKEEMIHGLCMRDIIIKYNISDATFYEMTKKYYPELDWSFIIPRCKLNKYQIEKIKELCKEGKSQKEVAKIMGTNLQLISYTLKRI